MVNFSILTKHRMTGNYQLKAMTNFQVSIFKQKLKGLYFCINIFYLTINYIAVEGNCILKWFITFHKP